MKRYIFFFLMVSGCFSCFGQIFKSEIDTTYIRLYPNTIKVKAIFLDRYYNLRLRAKSFDPVIKLVAREQSYFGLGLTVWNLNLDLSSLVPNPLEKKQIGEEDGFDIQLNLYTRRWNFDAGMARIENFSIKNTDIFGDLAEDSSIINTLNVKRIGLGGTYIFFPEKFSFRSPFIQVDRQLKSAGSPILSFGYTYATIKSDSLFTSQDAGIPPLGPLTSKAHKFELLPGYSYNFIYKAWFLNTTGAAGFDIQRSSANLDNESDALTQVDLLFELKGALGYHDDTFSAGVLIFYQFNRSKLDELSIRGNSGNLRVFAAYRFPAPHFIRKAKPKFLD